jgi:hypothetical protein
MPHFVILSDRGIEDLRENFSVNGVDPLLIIPLQAAPPLPASFCEPTIDTDF